MPSSSIQSIYNPPQHTYLSVRNTFKQMSIVFDFSKKKKICFFSRLFVADVCCNNIQRLNSCVRYIVRFVFSFLLFSSYILQMCAISVKVAFQLVFILYFNGDINPFLQYFLLLCTSSAFVCAVFCFLFCFLLYFALLL